MLTFPVKSGQAANLHRCLAVSTSRAKALGYQSEFNGDVPDNLRARATASTAQATVSILGNLEDLVLALRTAI